MEPELTIRPWRQSDARALNEAVAESLDHLRPWMPWASGPAPTEEWRRGWIRELLASEAEGSDLARGLFVGDTVVGAAGLHDRVGPHAREIGYWVHAGWTRRRQAQPCTCL